MNNKLFIQNIDRDDAAKGRHIDPGPNSRLIQISDPGQGFPTPGFKHFKEIHQFEFLDVEDELHFDEEVKISQEQANKLVALLQHALDNRMNVIVHCFAGICRSGAVVEVGEAMGFAHCDKFRAPNLRVKRMMFNALGWGYTDKMEQADKEQMRTSLLGWGKW